MAAAARLAKLGHSVRILEQTQHLGGGWAPREVDGVLVDDAPAVLTFPAPWRDLFRKSGRTLEAELARTGHALVPAGPARYVFGDGSELVLPADRGEQFAAVGDAYGTTAAERWRDLLDSLDRVWQAVRPLGLEAELPPKRRVDRVTLRTLQPRRRLDDLARDFGHPQLSAVIGSVAFRLGSVPARTPAWCAVQLSVERTFGRWTVHGAPDTGRSSVLLESLAQRLTLRRVAVELGVRVTAVDVADGRVGGIRLDDGRRLAADTVICAVDPWSAADLLGHRDRQRAFGAVGRLRPGAAPQISHRRHEREVDEVTETVHLGADGTPTAHYLRPAGERARESVHDWRHSRPRPAAGAAWDGFGSWFRRAPVTTRVRGLLVAGPASPAGPSPSAVVLSGALAAYASHGSQG